MQFILTPAGRAEMIAADNTGTAKVTISHIGVSASPDGLVGGQLAGEIKRLTTFAGSAVANVMVDGPITIPLMKRFGY